MRHGSPWIAALLIIAGLALVACSNSQAGAASKREAPYKLEKVEGTGLSRVILTKTAAERIKVQTVPLSELPIARFGFALRKVIPYSALIYDIKGDTWTYTNPQPLTYLRTKLVVDFIEGDRVVLVDGPDTGTAIVTVGAAELYGSETGIGK